MGPFARAIVWRSLGFFLVIEAMLVPAILFWPNFRDNLGALRAMAPLPMLKDMIDTLGKGGVAAYVLGQHYFKGCNTLGVAAAILFGMGVVAGEAQRGTLELWLARPLSRRRVLFERWLGGAAALALPVFVSSATIPWLVGYVDEEMEQVRLLWCSGYQTLFLLAVYSLTFVLSSVGRNPVMIAFVMLFFTTFQFAIYLVKTATHWSLFRLSDVPTYLKIYTESRVPAGDTALLAATCLVCLGASLFAFERRVP